MKNSYRQANIFFNLAMALLIGLLPILTMMVMAPQPIQAANPTHDYEIWDTVQNQWVKNNQIDWYEGDLIPHRLVLNNSGESVPWITPIISLRYDFYNGVGQTDAIGFDFLTNFRSADGTALSQPPSWWQTNGTSFTPTVLNRPYPSGDDLPPNDPNAEHYCQIGPYTVAAHQILIIYWEAHASMTTEWTLTNPCIPSTPTCYGPYGNHDGSSYFSQGAKIHTTFDADAPGWGGDASFPIISPIGAISGHKYLVPGNTGIPEWEICLSGTMPDGRPLNVCKDTDATGSYSFQGLNDGTWTVSEELKPGYIHTSSDNISVTISATQRVWTDIDFFNRMEEPTIFPEVPTECPVETTVCPVETTVCPVETTVCPVETTVCPVETTVCPVETTACPVETTVCPVETTVCPVETTVCPVETTVCPVETTVCPVETTVCPVETTVCPVETTVCPVETTVCPVNQTVCPVETTVCPVVSTQCPVVSTQCPATCGGGGGGGWGGISSATATCPLTLTVNMLGEITTVRMTSDGVLCEDCLAFDPENQHSWEAKAGTQLLCSGNLVPQLVQLTLAGSLPPPSNAVIVGPIFDLSAYTSQYNPCPSCTVSPLATFVLSYNPSGVPGSEVILAYYDPVQGWIPVMGTGAVAEIGKARGRLTHFTPFAVLAKVPEPTPAKFDVSNLVISPTYAEINREVTITVDVTNNGGTTGTYTLDLTINGTARETRQVTLAPKAGQSVTFTITESSAGKYRVGVAGLTGEFDLVKPVEPSKINWWLIIGITTGMIVLLAIWLTVKRRHATS